MPPKTVKEIDQSLSRDDHVVAPFTFQEIEGKILRFMITEPKLVYCNNLTKAR